MLKSIKREVTLVIEKAPSCEGALSISIYPGKKPYFPASGAASSTYFAASFLETYFGMCFLKFAFVAVFFATFFFAFGAGASAFASAVTAGFVSAALSAAKETPPKIPETARETITPAMTFFFINCMFGLVDSLESGTSCFLFLLRRSN